MFKNDVSILLEACWRTQRSWICYFWSSWLHEHTTSKKHCECFCKKQLSSTNTEKGIALHVYIFRNNKYNPFHFPQKIKWRKATVFSHISATQLNGGHPKGIKKHKMTKKTFSPQTPIRQLPYALIFFSTTNIVHFSSPKKLNCVRQLSSPIFRHLK